MFEADFRRQVNSVFEKLEAEVTRRMAERYAAWDRLETKVVELETKIDRLLAYLTGKTGTLPSENESR